MPKAFESPLHAGNCVICQSRLTGDILTIEILEDPRWSEHSGEYEVKIRHEGHIHEFRHLQADRFGEDLIFREVLQRRPKTIEEEFFERTANA